jgi:acyl-ACP thioesterase
LPITFMAAPRPPSEYPPPRSTDKFGPDLVDRAVTTLTYVVGDETKAIAAIFAL